MRLTCGPARTRTLALALARVIPRTPWLDARVRREPGRSRPVVTAGVAVPSEP
ncbi:hypothetical protein [Streptomyces sp. NPDC017940]|uniref:hypothetical protein n=1 Tax=Streptomyces sp. NPDC017940 TaxID=3365017 RepID=UPI00379F46BD